jgi:hypothetical protein
MPPNTSSGVFLSVPPGSGLTISAVSVYWYEPQATSGATTYAQAWSGSTLLGEAIDPVDHTYTPDNYTLPAGATDFRLQSNCAQSDGVQGCVIGSGSETPDLQMFGSQVTVDDGSAPTGSATGGALAAGGSVGGTQALSYGATDSVVGVRLVQLLVDGQAVAQDDYASQCPYTNFQACPATVSNTLVWNTASVPNGAHEVALRVVNAAGNTTVIDDHAIEVANSGSQAGNGDASSVLGSAGRWSVSLDVSPRQVHEHTVITLSGLVATSPRPPGGNLIYLQARTFTSVWRGRGHKRHRVRSHGRWITFKVMNTQPDGRFAATYRFRLGGDHRYQMRAVAPADGGFGGEQTGASSPALVTET